MPNELNFDSMELVETIQASFDHLILENPMGEARKDALRLDFDRRLKLEFHGTKVTSDAGLLAMILWITRSIFNCLLLLTTWRDGFVGKLLKLRWSFGIIGLTELA